MPPGVHATTAGRPSARRHRARPHVDVHLGRAAAHEGDRRICVRIAEIPLRDRTVAGLDVDLRVRSRRSIRSRVSQPLTVSHPSPNCSRVYPVIGARPLTGSAASAASALPVAPVENRDRAAPADVARPVDKCAVRLLAVDAEAEVDVPTHRHRRQRRR